MKRYDGDDFTHATNSLPNTGVGMRSTQERFPDPQPFQTQAPEEIPGVADEQRQRGNMGFRMNHDRYRTAPAPAKHRVRITKEAVWSYDRLRKVSSADRCASAMKPFREAVLVEQLALWADKDQAESMLEDLGFASPEVLGVLLHNTPLAIVSNGARKSIENLRLCLAEKELRHLRELPAQDARHRLEQELHLSPAQATLIIKHELFANPEAESN